MNTQGIELYKITSGAFGRYVHRPVTSCFVLLHLASSPLH